MVTDGQPSYHLKRLNVEAIVRHRSICLTISEWRFVSAGDCIALTLQIKVVRRRASREVDINLPCPSYISFIDPDRPFLLWIGQRLEKRFRHQFCTCVGKGEWIDLG